MRSTPFALPRMFVKATTCGGRQVFPRVPLLTFSLTPRPLLSQGSATDSISRRAISVLPGAVVLLVDGRNRWPATAGSTA